MATFKGERMREDLFASFNKRKTGGSIKRDGEP